MLKCSNCSFSYYCNEDCEFEDSIRCDSKQPSHGKMCCSLKQIEGMFRRIKGVVNSVVAHIFRDFMLWEYRNDEWHGDIVDVIAVIIMNSNEVILREAMSALVNVDHLSFDADHTVNVREMMDKLAKRGGFELIFEEPSLQKLGLRSKSFAAFLDKLQKSDCRDVIETMEELFTLGTQMNICWWRWKKMLLHKNTFEEYEEILYILAVKVGYYDNIPSSDRGFDDVIWRNTANKTEGASFDRI